MALPVSFTVASRTVLAIRQTLLVLLIMTSQCSCVAEISSLKCHTFNFYAAIESVFSRSKHSETIGSLVVAKARSDGCKSRQYCNRGGLIGTGCHFCFKKKKRDGGNSWGKRFLSP